jgi:putative hemolysin
MSKSENTEIAKFIDLEKLMESKNPGITKKLPGFIINYLKRILHQDEINQILHENKNLKNEEFCEDIIRRFNITLEMEGVENIPKEGGVILASNHPLGGMDALAVVSMLKPIRKDIKFIVNDLLMNLENLKDLFVGVNLHGKKSVQSLEKVNELFASDKAIFLFPSGLVSRKIKGKVQDEEWKKTFISRAKKFQKDIVPIHIDGRLSNFFYNLANLRTFFGIKANIEMLYLANELFKLKNQTVRITFGEPISYKSFTKEKSDKQWAEEVRKISYNL